MNQNPNFHTIDGFYYRQLNTYETEISGYDPVTEFGLPDQICVAIPETVNGLHVVSLGPDVFHYYDEYPITRIILPSGLREIKGNPFFALPSLKEITLPETNNAFVIHDDGVLFSSDQKHLICMIPKLRSWYEVPEGTRVIHEHAFDRCNLETAFVPDSVTEIRTGAFSGCSLLESIRLPAGLSEISDSVFANCFRLSRVELPPVTRIGEGAFSGCESLQEISVPSCCEEIGDYAFSGCVNLKGIELWSVRSIGLNPFLGCRMLSHVSLSPESSFRLQNHLLIDDENKSIACLVNREEDPHEYTVPDGVEAIGAFTFDSPELLAVHLPSSVRRLECFSFTRAESLKKVTLPENLESIEEGVFTGCDELRALYIPSGVRRIEADAFPDHESFCLIVHKDSVAEQYAKKYDIPFRLVQCNPDTQVYPPSEKRRDRE